MWKGLAVTRGISQTGMLASAGTGNCYSHYVYFHDHDSSFLTENVCRYVAEGLSLGENAILITTANRIEAFTAELEKQAVDTADCIRSQRLIFRGAEETLAQVILDGEPGWDRFDASVGELVRGSLARAERGVRAYGDMVGLLWNSGHSLAAERMEEFWNRLLQSNRFSLFCAYQIDRFGKEFQTAVLDRILRAHTCLVSSQTSDSLYNAIIRSTQEIFGVNGAKTLAHSKFDSSWPAMPDAEAAILWLRNNLPDYVDEILTRARRYYQASSQHRDSAYQLR